MLKMIKRCSRCGKQLFFVVPGSVEKIDDKLVCNRCFQKYHKKVSF